jgi:predicted nucleotidyltransferase
MLHVLWRYLNFIHLWQTDTKADFAHSAFECCFSHEADLRRLLQEVSERRKNFNSKPYGSSRKFVYSLAYCILQEHLFLSQCFSKQLARRGLDP